MTREVEMENLELEEEVICEACHKPHSNHHHGIVSELCRKCERELEERE